MEFIFLGIILILTALCIFVIVLKILQDKRISKLTDEINDFVENGKQTDFSVKDNNFARLQNSVNDLENLIILEKNNTLNETKKNIEFISDVSHQLKTPLAGIRLYCEMDNAVNKTEHTEKELMLIEKMENLIQNLLKLEKIRSDAYVMEFQKSETKVIIEEIITDLKHIFPQKEYTVTGNGVLRCDKSWLKEAISNVIKNASEHTDANGKVDVCISQSSKSTIIEIQDNGGGIDEEEISELFTRFCKTKISLPTSAGIGLAITKAIVEKHHGIISAENKNGGLCITMCFPHIDGIITI